MNPVRWATVVVSVLAVATAVSTAYGVGNNAAAIPDAGLTFYACARAPTAVGQGTPVLIIDPITTPTCPAGYLRLSWKTGAASTGTGPAGPAGPEGLRGLIIESMDQAVDAGIRHLRDRLKVRSAVRSRVGRTANG